jgi:hypothetical protein
MKPDVNSGNKKSTMDSDTPVPAVQKVLTPAALRALAEADERRQAQAEKERQLSLAREVNGRGGNDPVRYNDWEIKGLTADF